MNGLVKGILTIVLLSYPFLGSAEEPKQADKPKVAVGEKAPDFKIKGPDGKVIDLAELTAKGPVLLRLTCGCGGCDNECAYYQEVCKAYKDLGLVGLFVFRTDLDFWKELKDPDGKVNKYAEKKKLDLLYATDPKGEAWDIFQTKTMPTNILIEKGGKITAIARGWDASGLMAQKLSEKAAKAVDTKSVDVKAKVEEEKQKKKEQK